MTPRLSRYRLSLLLAIATLTLFSGLTAADPVKTEHAQAQLISEAAAFQPGKPFWVALRLQVIPGWHTYWRNPGDSGLATTLHWQLPPGFTAGPIQWPYPERFLLEGPLMNYGYEDEVYLLTRITPAETMPNDAPVTLQARARWLVCREICVPEEGLLTLTLPVSRTTPPVNETWADAFAKTRRALPEPSPWQVSYSTTEEELVLHIPAPAAEKIKALQFFPFAYGVIEYAAPQKMKVDPQGITLSVARGVLPDDQFDRVQGVLVLQEQIDGGLVTRALEIDAPPLARLPSSSSNPTQ